MFIALNLPQGLPRLLRSKNGGKKKWRLPRETVNYRLSVETLGPTVYRDRVIEYAIFVLGSGPAAISGHCVYPCNKCTQKSVRKVQAAS